MSILSFMHSKFNINVMLPAGAVSFGQIVKAGEPVFAAATNAILLGVIMGSNYCRYHECNYCYYAAVLPLLLFLKSPLYPSLTSPHLSPHLTLPLPSPSSSTLLTLAPSYPHSLTPSSHSPFTPLPHHRISTTQWCTLPSSPSSEVSDSPHSRSSPSLGPPLSLRHLPTRLPHSRTSCPRY